jgi:hypothetical protein
MIVQKGLKNLLVIFTANKGVEINERFNKVLIRKRKLKYWGLFTEK